MVDVNLQIPALDKLVDYVASGIGAVAGSMLAPWKARREGEARRIASKAEADARLIEAAADADSLRTIASAQAEARRRLQVASEPDGRPIADRVRITERIEFQEKKRQRSIVSVVRDAANVLGNEHVADHQPDPDWTARFFVSVQDVSSDDMQKLWSRLLAGEVRSPGTTSLRTLDILRNMTREDALKFDGIASFMIDDFAYWDAEVYDDEGPMEYGVLLHLQNCGLLNVGSLVAVTLGLDRGKHGWHGMYQDYVLRIQSRQDNAVKSVQVPCISLTRAGSELLQVTNRTVQEDYLRTYARFLNDKGCRLFRSKIISRLPGGRVTHYNKFDEIDPGSEG